MANTYIRPKDKLENYVELLMKKYGNCSTSMGLRSRYYTIDNKVLRISDHIGANNDAHVSIIVPAFRNTGQQYIIHAHKSGQISIVPYEKAKEVVRSFFYLSSIFGELALDRNAEIGNDIEEKNNMTNIFKQLKELEKYRNKAIDKGKSVLGVPIGEFTKGQLNSITALVDQVKKKLEAKNSED